VYVVVPTEAVLIVAGFHVPVMPLVEVEGNAGAVPFWHSGPIEPKAGVMLVVIVISIATAVAHCPASGVNVYVVVPTEAVLIVAGFHVPVIPLVDVVGKAGAMLFWQSGPIAAKAGVMLLVIVISTVTAAAS